MLSHNHTPKYAATRTGRSRTNTSRPRMTKSRTTGSRSRPSRTGRSRRRSVDDFKSFQTYQRKRSRSLTGSTGLAPRSRTVRGKTGTRSWGPVTQSAGKSRSGMSRSRARSMSKSRSSRRHSKVNARVNVSLKSSSKAWSSSTVALLIAAFVLVVLFVLWFVVFYLPRSRPSDSNLKMHGSTQLDDKRLTALSEDQVQTQSLLDKFMGRTQQLTEDQKKLTDQNQKLTDDLDKEKKDLDGVQARLDEEKNLGVLDRMARHVKRYKWIYLGGGITLLSYYYCAGETWFGSRAYFNDAGKLGRENANQIQLLGGRVTGLEGDHSALHQQLNTLQKNQTGLATQIDNVKAEINSRINGIDEDTMAKLDKIKMDSEHSRKEILDLLEDRVGTLQGVNDSQAEAVKQLKVDLESQFKQLNVLETKYNSGHEELADQLSKFNVNLVALEKEQQHQKELFTEQLGETNSKIQTVSNGLKLELARLSESTTSHFSDLDCQTASHKDIITALQKDLQRVEDKTGTDAASLRQGLEELKTLQNEQKTLFDDRFKRQTSRIDGIEKDMDLQMTHIRKTITDNKANTADEIKKIGKLLEDQRKEIITIGHQSGEQFKNLTTELEDKVNELERKLNDKIEEEIRGAKCDLMLKFQKDIRTHESRLQSLEAQDQVILEKIKNYTTSNADLSQLTKDVELLKSDTACLGCRLGSLEGIVATLKKELKTLDDNTLKFNTCYVWSSCSD